MAEITGSPPRKRRGLGRLRLLVSVVGVLLIVAGVAVVAVPLLQVWQRGRADDRALQDWNGGGSANLQGAAGDSHDPLPASTCGGTAGAGGAYALVTFPSLTQYRYAGVAGDGTWDMLKDRSMVHYQTTPAPGAQGNVIIAFHREPNFEHIDQLGVGAEVDVQDRSCQVWHYRVTERQTLDPEKLTQLVQTGGHDLTLVTCTPWYMDTQRIVWRAQLVQG